MGNPSALECEEKRTTLTAIRYAATVVSNITIYLTTWAFFGIGEGTDQIDDRDDEKFR